MIDQPAAFIRRDMAKRVNWLYPVWFHDWDLWRRVSLAGGKIQRVSHLLGCSRVRRDKSQYRPQLLIEGLVGMTERFFSLPGVPEDVRRLRRRALSNCHVKIVETLRHSGAARSRAGPHTLPEGTAAVPAICPTSSTCGRKRAGRRRASPGRRAPGTTCGLPRRNPGCPRLPPGRARPRPIHPRRPAAVCRARPSPSSSRARTTRGTSRRPSRAFSRRTTRTSNASSWTAAPRMARSTS